MATTKPVRKDDQDPDEDQDTDATAKPAQAAGDGDDGDTTDWKAEARKWERRAKEANKEAREGRSAADRLRELEDADKSESEKAAKRVADAEAKAAAAERRALVAEIALEKGLSATMARRLVGDTREDLESDADDLLEAFAAKGGPADGAPAGDGRKPEPRRTPKEDLKPGASNDDPESDELSPKEAAEIADRIAKGATF